MDEDTPPVLPTPQRTALMGAYRAYRGALDPDDAWANSLLASVVVAAAAAGWPQRKTADALGINRPRMAKLSRFEPAEAVTIEAYTFGADFPDAAAAVFRRHEDEVNLRRIRTERRLVSLLRAAHEAGWPYPRLGALLGITGEGARRIAEIDVPLDKRIPAFPAYRRRIEPDRPAAPAPALTAAEKTELAALAEQARTATKHSGTRMRRKPEGGQLEALRRAVQAREASEKLSRLIVAAKQRGIRWADLDEACGYSPGAARSRAMRHGYGKTPPTMAAYKPTPERAYRLAGLTPPAARS